MISVSSDGHAGIGIGLIALQLERGQGSVIVQKQSGLARLAEFIEELLQIELGIGIEHVRLLVHQSHSLQAAEIPVPTSSGLLPVTSVRTSQSSAIRLPAQR